MKTVTKRPMSTRTVPASTPAPFKGLDTVSSLSAMDQASALTLTNFIATPQGVSLRPGTRKWATSITGTVTSLLPYHPGDNSAAKLFAVAGSNIYDVTASGAVGAAVVSGLNAASPYWQSTSMTYTTGGTHWLFAVNGVDYPRMYNGTAWTTCSQTATPAAPGQFASLDNNGNAVDIRNFVDVLTHQQRLWFVRDNSTLAYYCDIAQVGGSLYAFDFGPLFPRGGKLFKLATWTIDTGGGQGTQSLLVAISNRGDVAVYMGNNPAVSTSWSLLACYQIGSPVGRRCTTQYQGDLLILSQDGLYPLSKYLQSDRVSAQSAVTYSISPTIGGIVATYGSYPGFELIVYPGQNVLLLNVPQVSSTNNFQFCYHTITTGWSQLTGIAASCWCLFNDTLYFGTSGGVSQGLIGTTDDATSTGTGGSPITGVALTSFTTMPDASGLGPGITKSIKAVKPFITSGSAPPTVRVGVNVDYNLDAYISSSQIANPPSTLWDSALFDSPTSTWMAATTVSNDWAEVAAYPGEAIALMVSATSSYSMLWTSTSWLIEPGNQFG